MVGGGCSLLRLSTKVESIKRLLENEEQKVTCFPVSFTDSKSRYSSHYSKIYKSISFRPKKIVGLSSFDLFKVMKIFKTCGN